MAAARLPRPMPVAVRENARAKNVVLRLIPGQGLVITMPVGLPPSRLAEAVGARSAWREKPNRSTESDTYSTGPGSP